MDIIKKQTSIEYYSSPILSEYFGERSLCTFDIETLGLDPVKAPVILAGFMEVSPSGKAEITQYFLETPEKEYLLLDRIISELNSRDVIVTYNGYHFDIPYVIKRYKMIHHASPDIRPFDLDLYPVIKRHSGLKGILPSFRQKAIEEYMGISMDRRDEISGAESVELYYHYLIEEDPILKDELRNKIMLHNYDDVVQLYRLLPILRQCDLHCAFSKIGFPVFDPVDPTGMIMKICSLHFGRTHLEVTGTYTGEPFVYKSFSGIDRVWDAEFDRDRNFKVNIPVIRRSGAVYVNLFDFFASTDGFEDMEGFINGFLILRKDGETLPREINRFVYRLLENIITG